MTTEHVSQIDIIGELKALAIGKFNERPHIFEEGDPVNYRPNTVQRSVEYALKEIISQSGIRPLDLLQQVIERTPFKPQDVWFTSADTNTAKPENWDDLISGIVVTIISKEIESSNPELSHESTERWSDDRYWKL